MITERPVSHCSTFVAVVVAVLVPVVITVVRADVSMIAVVAADSSETEC